MAKASSQITRRGLWKGQDDMGFPEGDAIALRFRMDKAQIFGLEFE